MGVLCENNVIPAERGKENSTLTKIHKAEGVEKLCLPHCLEIIKYIIFRTRYVSLLVGKNNHLTFGVDV